MEQKLIVFVGMPGAGKSMCVEHLKSKGFNSVYFGGITIDEIKKRGLELNPENEKIVREDIRKKYGNDVYAKRIIDKIKLINNSQPIVIDGLYSWTEYKMFKSEYGDSATIVAVVAPRSLRHKRLSSRPVRPLNDKQATDREYSEIEKLEKGGPIANADYYLTNQKDINDLQQAIDRLLIETGIN